MNSAAARLYAEFREAAYFPSLNGIRAICALMVIKLHVDWSVPGSPQILDFGFLGVDMFFVISGFLIVTLLLREREARGRFDLGQFYLRRTLRIFPIYYLLIAFLVVLALATYRHSSRTWDLYKWSFPVFALYLQDIVPTFMGMMYHTWSLPMEEQFYLAWPAVERAFGRAWIIPTLLVLLALNEMCNFGVFAHALTAIYGPGGPMRPMFLITFTPILLGVLGAHLLHEPRTGEPIAAVLGNRWAPPLLMAMAMLVCEVSVKFQGLDRMVVHLLFWLALMAMVLNPRGIFARTLQSRVLSYLGSISYGIYLYHVIVLVFVQKLCEARHLSPGPFTMFVAVTSLATGVAALSYRYIETPIMRSRRRLPGAASIATAQPAA
jgi:peptidoglycan/LPS O-acetylase OafA/YrhL